MSGLCLSLNWLVFPRHLNSRFEQHVWWRTSQEDDCVRDGIGKYAGVYATQKYLVFHT